MADVAVMEVRKRKQVDNSPLIESKRAKFDYIFTVDSTGDETESICSIQDKETDIAKDTSDTTGSEYSLEIEYEIATSDEEDLLFDDSSSSGLDDIIATAGAIGKICTQTIDACITDWEDSSDNSSKFSEFEPTDFGTCIQCNSKNDNPRFRYCEKCFQPRCRRCNTSKSYKCFPLCNTCFKLKKHSLPPRPKGNRKKKKRPVISPLTVNVASPVISSQDSGIGNDSDKNGSNSQEDANLPESKELCIICSSNPKNSIFLHGSIAHLCCCYKCAIKTWKTHKKCPMCNCKVQNVVKVFTN